MSLVLARIDQRLVHGQVSVGWIPVLQVDRVLVVDDELCEDEWERDLIAGGAPPGVDVDVVPSGEAVELLADPPGRTLLLVRTPAAMLDLVQRGCPISEVNVGGIHARPDSERVLDYVHVTREDAAALVALHRAGVRLVAQELPGHPAVDLDELLGEHRSGTFPFVD